MLNALQNRSISVTGNGGIVTIPMYHYGIPSINIINAAKLTPLLIERNTTICNLHEGI